MACQVFYELASCPLSCLSNSHFALLFSFSSSPSGPLLLRKHSSPSRASGSPPFLIPFLKTSLYNLHGFFHTSLGPVSLNHHLFRESFPDHPAWSAFPAPGRFLPFLICPVLPHGTHHRTIVIVFTGVFVNCLSRLDRI